MKLTPNRRLALYTRGMPLSTWVNAYYNDLRESDPTLPYLLSSNEEVIIWEKIIATSEIGKTLLKTSSTAKLAREAWLLSVQWQISLAALDGYFQTDERLAFLEWANRYQSLCQKERWVDSATVIDILHLAITQKKLVLPSEITLVGFEELTPQLVKLFEAVKASGTVVLSSALVSKQGSLYRLPVADTETEFKFALLKAKQWLDQNPEARIGLVVPALEEQRAMVVRLCEALLPVGSFNIAAPSALGRYAMIDAAFLGLSFLMGEISLEKFSRFLRSPFFTHAYSEQTIRAAIDIKLREFAESAFTLESVIKKLDIILKQEPRMAGFSGLASLQKLALMRDDIRGKQTNQYWIEKFSEILNCLGWPGDRELTPEELELSEQWQKLLTDYLSMERVLGEHRYFEAVSHLQKLAQNMPFAPASTHTGRTRGSAPVQILGILEALGMPFDALWVTGLHREAWPPEPAPNPFIPIALQRKWDLPRSSAARELKMARQFTARLSEGGQEVIFSYPTTIDDRAVSASALIADMPVVTASDLELLNGENALENSLERSLSLLPKIDLEENAPVVGKTEKIKGGTQILKLQALCPFRAFAETRLEARPIPTQSLGLNAAERGEIIHQILERFWQGLENQTQLLALSDDSLQDRIQGAVDEIFTHWQQKYPRTLTPQYLLLEKQRTFELIERFIALEKTRPYFEIVSTEQKGVVDLEGLEIKIRIDRIDRLDNQAEILVDYKTGEVSINNWFGDRPKDPQLPLYCVTRENPKPTGIVFGVIRPDMVKYQGLVDVADALPGVKNAENFEEQRVAWQDSLRRLASEFMQGMAKVDPLEGANTCRTCSLKSLCRVGVV